MHRAIRVRVGGTINKALLDVLFASEKRKNMLLMLKDGPVEITSLLCDLNASRQALLPQAKVLEENYLVSKDGQSYELTSIGALILERMLPAIGTVNVLEENVDYWGSHDLDFIPEYLLRRLDELDPCTIIEPDIYNIFELNEEFIETSKKSEYVNSFISFLHPDHLQIFLDLMDRDIDASLIVSENLFQKLREEYNDDFRELILTKSVKLFLYKDKMDLVSFSINDHCSVMRLLTKSYEYDSKQLVCKGQKALEWGQELFEYYRKRSVPVTSFEK